MKILVIEDDPDVAEYITLALSIGWPGMDVIVATTGEKGVELASEIKPEIVTVDLGLPGLNGFEVIRIIRSFSKVPVIVLTVRGEEGDIVRALELGADEYVVKPFGQMELIARIRALLRRQTNTGSEPIVFGNLTLDMDRKIVRKASKEILLTNTEAIILKLLIGNEGKTVSYSTIAKKLWGECYPESPDTIKVHIRHLREKIEDEPNEPQTILTRFKVGYYISRSQ